MKTLQADRIIIPPTTPKGLTIATTKSVPAKKASVKKAAAKKVTSKKTASPKDAIGSLRADHKWASDLFEQCEKARCGSRKFELARKTCKELSLHAQVEEEIFHPAVKAALKDKELVPQATLEHATLKDLIAQAEGKPSGGEMYGAKIKAMSEYVQYRVKEEQNEMFPKARSIRLDMIALGGQTPARKQALRDSYS